MYYGLSNYYQNHRRYVKSRDDEQLLGNIINPDDLNNDCDPYKTEEQTDKGYAPCGAIANSLFNGKCGCYSSKFYKKSSPLIHSN